MNYVFDSIINITTFESRGTHVVVGTTIKNGNLIREAVIKVTRVRFFHVEVDTRCLTVAEE